jgi:nucleotide-binding universal stress UspA family protein
MEKRLILVPLDGSAFAERAVPVATELARRTGAGVRLVHVHMRVTADPIYVDGLAVIDEHMHSLGREHEQAYLDQARKRLAADGDLSAVLLYGPVADALADYVDSSGAMLIVMTTHGRGGLERAWLGSVADELIRVSPAPLLLVRPEPGSVPRPFRRILVPLDGSPAAEAILVHAIELARLEADSELILLNVVQPIWVPDGAFAPTASGREVTRRQEERARKYLHRLARRLEASGLRVRTRVQTATTVALAILDAARGEQADIVALAAHGRSGIRRLTLGSVADKVVRGSPVPVLVFRPSEALPAELRGREAEVELPGGLSSTAPQALANTASQEPS